MEYRELSDHILTLQYAYLFFSQKCAKVESTPNEKIFLDDSTYKSSHWYCYMCSCHEIVFNWIAKNTDIYWYEFKKQIFEDLKGNTLEWLRERTFLYSEDPRANLPFSETTTYIHYKLDQESLFQIKAGLCPYYLAIRPSNSMSVV